MVTWLLNRIRPDSCSNTFDVNESLSPAQFRRLLERERARTDRNGQPFVVLSFSARSEKSQLLMMKEVARVFRQRLRKSDETGWLDDRRLAAFLPDTSPRGGWKVAEDLLALYRADAEKPLCELYCYPRDCEDLPPVTDGAANQSLPPPVRPMEIFWMQKLPTWKRMTDVLGALIGLAVTLPVLVCCAVAIKMTSPGPVLFCQTRRGLGGQRFVMYKLRTMHVDAESRREELASLNEQDGPAFKIKNDPRSTPVGNFLRHASLDELPQLINVLKGEMSLVGPRPLPCNEADACLLWQKRRLDVTPGLTCTWQVHGSDVSFVEWMRMDLQYLNGRTFSQDAWLILETAAAVLLRKKLR